MYNIQKVRACVTETNYSIRFYKHYSEISACVLWWDDMREYKLHGGLQGQVHKGYNQSMVSEKLNISPGEKIE